MTGARASRAIPIQSVGYADPASCEAARDCVFLDELGRQAGLATRNIGEAWKRGMQTEDPRDMITWSLLQGALFAATIVVRILKPRSVSRYPGKTLRESNEITTLRGKRLCGHLPTGIRRCRPSCILPGRRNDPF